VDDSKSVADGDYDPTFSPAEAIEFARGRVSAARIWPHMPGVADADARLARLLEEAGPQGPLPDTPGITTAREAVFNATKSLKHDKCEAVMAMFRLVEALEADGRDTEARKARMRADHDFADVLAPSQRALAAAQRSNDLPAQAVALIALGKVLKHLAKPTEAELAFDDAQRITDRALAEASRPAGIYDDGVVVPRPSMLARLGSAWADSGHSASAARVRETAQQIGQGVEAAVDIALRAAALARQSHSPVGERQAMLMLAGVFHELGRTSEAEFCDAEAARPAVREDGVTVSSPDTARASGLQYLRRGQDFDRRPGIRRYYSFEQARGQVTYSLGPDASYDVELLVGYVAVKLIGPFLEAFAKKLGEQIGESTSRALGRLRVLRDRRTRRTELDVNGSSTTTLVLPEDMTDEARLAFLDLDMTASELQGTTLYWDEKAGKWLPTVQSSAAPYPKRRP
jgi:hypothetical protein